MNPDTRAAVLRRDDHRCRAANPNGTPCSTRADDVAHVVSPRDETPGALIAVCARHRDTPPAVPA